jgi:hypothetical protein
MQARIGEKLLDGTINASDLTQKQIDKYNYKIIDGVVYKQCNKCDEIKELSEFELRPEYGVQRNQCKTCISKRRKQHYNDNKEYILNRNKKYYEEHKDTILEYQVNWRKENHEYLIKYEKRRNNDPKRIKWKENYNKIRKRKYNKKYNKLYRNRSDVKARIKAYRNRPDVKARLKIYRKQRYQRLKQQSILKYTPDDFISNNTNEQPCFLYIITHYELDIFKIGISNNVDRRLLRINKVFGESEVYVTHRSSRTKCKLLEQSLHIQFNKFQYKDFQYLNSYKCGHTEWFYNECLNDVVQILSKSQSLKYF